MEINGISDSESFCRDLHQPGIIIAGCFVIVALSLSIFLILQHLRSYTNPAEQKWIVAVVFMIPVYATESIISLWNPKLSLACDILRNCYEAFASYSFWKLFGCLFGYPYMAVVLNFSQMWALCCLVQFYNVTYERLQCIKPLSKFISFKAIVFATWWQGVGIALLREFGVVPREGKLQTALQDFLICIEVCVRWFCRWLWQLLPMCLSFLRALITTSLASEYGKVANERTKGEVKLGGGDTPAVLEKHETKVEAPETSVTESVQDIVPQGGQHVVKDVLTINQAMGPVEKEVTKIQETFHRKSLLARTKNQMNQS